MSLILRKLFSLVEDELRRRHVERRHGLAVAAAARGGARARRRGARARGRARAAAERAARRARRARRGAAAEPRQGAGEEGKTRSVLLLSSQVYMSVGTWNTASTSPARSRFYFSIGTQSMLTL